MASSTPYTGTATAPSALSLRRRKALADALAGVVATLVSLWTFYPVDVWKTKMQAGTSNVSGKDQLGLSTLFRGIQLKTLHAASSSFCYFYLYSTIVSWWTTHHNHNNNHTNQKLSPAVRLLLSAVAAMMNTFLTLPLDVLSSQQQAASCDFKEGMIASDVDETQDESSSSQEGDEYDLRLTLIEKQQRKMDQIWNQLQQPTNTSSVVEDEGDVFYDSCSEPYEQSSPFSSRNNNAASLDSEGYEDDEEEKKNDSDDEYHNEKTSPASIQRGRITVTVTTCSAQTSHTPAARSKSKLLYVETTSTTSSSSTSSASSDNPQITSPCKSTDASFSSQYAALWKGLYPSLLLCSNPSIHYTVFDMAKSHLLQSRLSSRNNFNLSMTEAFLVGLFAKFCATMATYPLIRAKVMLMVTSQKSMVQILARLLQQEGIVKGWYKGCSVQLLHTLLKSALLMMVKEGISSTIHKLLLVPQPSQQQQ